MSDDKDEAEKTVPPAAPEQRTIFMPGESESPPGDPPGGEPASTADEAAAPDPETPQASEGWDSPPEVERTQWQPSEQSPPPPVASTPPPQTTSMGGPLIEPRSPTGGIQIGDVLNHIFEVKRFIARGGMGEVFEGCNVNSDERVAIKVMLPALASDPNIISMFRKEARTLTRLQHEALVQYRVLAQEPQLGVLYIVTEFVDGVNLSDVLGTIKASPADLAMLLRRLAGGLRAAHALGAIHRDMSPDNVLLEGSKLSGAKVIDFGIAKDLDPGSATIVGDGFAGKLNYVAPEQLGDFGREVGPWSDVYSLGLVILATAMGRDVQMGGTLVDAVDKRRAGPDLTPAPEALRPILAKMLAANPAERFRSMDEVLAALDGAPIPVATTTAPTTAAAAPPKRSLLIGGAAGAALIAAGAIYFMLPSHKPGSTGPSDASPATTTAAATGKGEPVDVARAAINGALPAVACSWLDVTQLSAAGGRMVVRLTGVAGNPAAAQNAISSALSSAGINTADIDFAEVAQIEPPGCSALDAYRQIRSPDPGRLSVPSRTFEIEPVQDGDTSNNYARASKAVINLSIGNPNEGLALAGIEPSGKVEVFVGSRAALRNAIATSQHGEQVDLGGDRFRLQSEQNHTGWSGVLLLTGKEPFDPAVVAPAVGARDAGWRQRFVDTARERGWKAEMVWFKSVDEKPG